MKEDRLHVNSWRRPKTMDGNSETEERQHSTLSLDRCSPSRKLLVTGPSLSGSLDVTQFSQQQTSSTTKKSVYSKANRTLRSIVEKKAIRPEDADECLFETSRNKIIREQTKLQSFTQSRHYEMFSALLVCSNAIFIGYQTECLAQLVDNSKDGDGINMNTDPLPIILGSVLFTVLFSIELGLRWISDGLFHFFVSSDISWRLFDVFIVVLCLVDSFWSLTRAMALNNAGKTHLLSSVSALRVLRVVRIVKLARIIRMMSFFRELRIMIYSILGCTKSLVWVTLILAMCFYIFGITFTLGTAEYVAWHAMWEEPSSVSLRNSFGTLSRSFLSLYMAMAGGRSWGEYYKEISLLSWQYPALFLVFLTFTIFSVLNIVTAVFVDSAFQATHKIRQIVIHEELEQKRDYLKALRDLFSEMDVNGDGSISIDEFEDRLCDERVIAFFKAMKLDVSDSRTLFNLLDKDRSGQVDIVEFLNGCYQLQGESRSIDTKILRIQVTSLMERMMCLEENQQALLEEWP